MEKCDRRKRLRVNVGKTKAFCTGERAKTKICVKDPCSLCGKGVGSNSIQCHKCTKWVHKRCTNIKGSLLTVKNFECSACQGCINDEACLKRVCLAGDEIEKVESFCYLGDVLSTEGGVQGTVTARIRAGWKRFKDISAVLCTNSLSLKLRGLLYKIYVRSAMSYGKEMLGRKS